MSCRQINKELATLQRMRELAKMAARMDGVVYVIYKKNGEFKFEKESEHTGVVLEYLYP